MASWNDLQAFIGRLNAFEFDRRYRLPSEAESEYLAYIAHPDPGTANRRRQAASY